MGSALRQRWSRLPRWVRAPVTLAVLFFVVPWASVQLLPVSWAFIWGAWALALFVLAFGRPRRRLRAVWFNVGVACLALAGLEVYFELNKPEEPWFDNADVRGYVQADADLGYAPVPGAVRTIARYFRDERIYAVTYHIGDRGERVSPSAQANADGEATPFFGCSMTFGEGLEDDQTYPHLVGALSGGRIAPVNLAFSGWGPHQMLAMLESGRAAEVVEGTPRHAFYMLIASHANRLSGKVRWDRHGPRYRLAADGSVRRDGNFGSGLSSFERRMRKWLRASHIFRRVSERPVGPEAFELLGAIVAAAEARIASLWPGCKLHVLIFDRPGRRNDEAIRALEARGLTVHRMSTVLPGFKANHLRYALHPQDLHPTAEANRLIAAWIVKEILHLD